MLRYKLFVASSIFVASSVFATEHASDNSRLIQMFNEDQASRASEPIDWDLLSKQDSAHREEVLSLLAAGKLHSAKDFARASMIMQHGTTTDDYRLAFSFAQISSTLDPSLSFAKSLSALAWDRLLMSKNRPQWYGTQYDTSPDGKTTLYPVEVGAVSDEERKALGLPTLEEAKAKAAAMSDD